MSAGSIVVPANGCPSSVIVVTTPGRLFVTVTVTGATALMSWFGVGLTTVTTGGRMSSTLTRHVVFAARVKAALHSSGAQSPRPEPGSKVPVGVTVLPTGKVPPPPTAAAPVL